MEAPPQTGKLKSVSPMKGIKSLVLKKKKGLSLLSLKDRGGGGESEGGKRLRWWSGRGCPWEGEGGQAIQT